MRCQRKTARAKDDLSPHSDGGNMVDVTSEFGGKLRRHFKEAYSRKVKLKSFGREGNC